MGLARQSQALLRQVRLSRGGLGRALGSIGRVAGDARLFGQLPERHSRKDDANDDHGGADDFDDKPPPVALLGAFLLFSIGVAGIGYGLWNLKLGPQDWRGGLSWLFGSVGVGYATFRFLLWWLRWDIR